MSFSWTLSSLVLSARTLLSASLDQILGKDICNLSFMDAYFIIKFI